MSVQLLREFVKESLTPDPDGANTVFSTTSPYKAGTVSVWMNGLRKIEAWDNGFVELGGTDIQMNEAPLVGDSLQAQYEPA